MRCHRVFSAVLGAVQSNVTSAQEFAITSAGKASVPPGLASEMSRVLVVQLFLPFVSVGLRISFQRALGRGTFPWAVHWFRPRGGSRRCAKGIGSSEATTQRHRLAD